jgi:alpha-1,2-mannosyltransferase
MAAVVQSVGAALRRSPVASIAGALAFAVVVAPLVLEVLTRPRDQLLVDLDVYRDAGASVLMGRPVYATVSTPPQVLPFTYPPLAALLAAPLVALRLETVGLLWTAGQLALLAALAAAAFRPALAGFGRWQPVAFGALVGGLAWLLPVRDGLRFGQVNLALIALVLADFLVRRASWPRGLLVGLATAVKLTPGVFLLHLMALRRRRAAWTALAAAAGCTVLAWLVLPGDSADFWLSAVFDTDRLGSNRGTSNQSLRGMLLRLGYDSTALWLLACLPVGLVGFWLASRAARGGQELAGVTIVGLLAVLLSPVAWIHHLAWVVVALGVLLGDASDLRRVSLVLGTWAYFWAGLPWDGVRLLGDPGFPHGLARLLQESYGLGALALIPLLAWAAARDPAVPAPAVEQPAPVSAGVTPPGSPPPR